MAGRWGPMWYDPPPHIYPWPTLFVPKNISDREAEELVDQIKDVGNKSLRHGNYYDALWKYNHCLVLCRDHNLPKKGAIIKSNCSQACLFLNYYQDAYTHAHEAIALDPRSKILHKMLYRRAQAARLICTDMVEKGEEIPNYFFLEEAVRDFCECFRLMNFDPKPMCEAIFVAVNFSLTNVPISFMDSEVQSGATTKVLHEMLSRPDTKHAHLEFLLYKVPCAGAKHARNFDCSGVQFSVLCKKSMEKKLLERMFAYGMLISPEDVALAVDLLPDTTSPTLDLIASRCEGPPETSLSLAYVAAENSSKYQLLITLLKRRAQRPVPPKKRVADFKAEGNAFYGRSKYSEALAKYYEALPICQQHNLVEDEALIRGNCAQTCLQLELFKDAYEHANECLRLDPESAKGYYRRAEALRKMLENREMSSRAPEGSGFAQVVTDYFQCHRKTETSNIKAIFQAMAVATNNNCTKSLPKLTDAEISSGLANRILVELVQRDDSQQKHFATLLFTLVPNSKKMCIDASSLKVSKLLKEKSITSLKLIERLFTLGMKVNESDVSSAVGFLPERRADVLHLLIKECTKIRKCTFATACQEAIKAEKIPFIVCLIKNGGKPDVENLKRLTGWPKHRKIDQVIDAYLLEQNTKKKTPEKPEFVPPSKDLPDFATAMAKAKQNVDYGDVFMKQEEYLLAERKYHEALVLYTLYDRPIKAGEVYYKLAQVDMEMGLFDCAFQQCTESIKFNPNAEGYFLRATILQEAILLPHIAVPHTIKPGTVVSDYCTAHLLKDNVEALTEAIIFAVDNNCHLSQLKNPKRGPLMGNRHVQSGFCTQLLRSLLSHHEAKEAHIKLLVEIPIHADPPHFDGSKVKVSNLLKKKFTHEKIMKCLLQCGMKIDKSDMKVAVKTLPGDNSRTLDILCAHFKGDMEEMLNAACQLAVKEKKIKLVLCLLKRGCKLPCSSQESLTVALQQNFADVAESLLPFCKLPEVDLGLLLHNCMELVNHKHLIAKMIDSGMNPSGIGEEKPLAIVQQISHLTKKVDLICLLLMKGCDCSQLCHGVKYKTTPVHIATSIGLQAGADACTKVLDAVVASETFDVEKYGTFVDERGNTPLHLTMGNQKHDLSLKLVRALIETHKLPIDPSIPDNCGKRVTDTLKKKDSRKKIFTMATERVQQAVADKETKKQKDGLKSVEMKEEKIPPVTNPIQGEEKASEGEKSSGNKTPPKIVDPYKMLSLTEKLELHLKFVLGKGSDYFVVAAEEEDGVEATGGQQIGKKETQNAEFLKASAVREKKSPSPCLSPEEEEGEDESDNEMNTVMSRYGLDDFDGLPWEVEGTNNVLKFFKSEKVNPYKLRLRAAKTVYELAQGKRGQKLSKRLSTQSSNLFEARISKGGRIIWQKAVQFSPRRTGEYSNPIYAQVIRIWEIVPQHDMLAQTIDSCVKQIESSNEKGLKASLNVPLKPQKEVKQKKQSVRKQEQIEIPKIFTAADVSVSDSAIERYTPAASHKEDEFNVTTFYSFSGAVLKSMLTGSNARRDFPFKEWPKEHEIINLPDTESILLLGRSGTGKTTCCLYRLWNEFRMYWDCPNIIMLPRKPLVTLKLSALEESDDVNIEEEETFDPEIMKPTSERVEGASAAKFASNKVVDNCPEQSKEQLQVDNEQDGIEDSICSSMDDVAEVDMDDEINEHLHQVFVTKNYVLCAQMKRRFYDMAAAHDFLDEHLTWESEDIPHSFAEINDYAYPLFLTARQFYILLDNSIGGEQCFFRPREKDGSLKVKILSTDYDHEDPDTLLDLEDSDNEEEDNSSDPVSTGLQVPKQHAQKYVEVTSLYFTEYIWPEISKKCGVRHLDPMLVWIEIQSFIKGSRMAILKGSPLPLNEYLEIGYKMAPNFADEREAIYDLYKRYEDYCQNKRHSIFLFDECDLVHDIHRRLRSVNDLPWSIHSLYVDEVQDFTQAELALYLHCVRHPNSLFFTGDTAQSIMRGIAFRFEDLRSSFHAINRVVPQVKVPQKPHTLTINFRSHSGILQLAGSIIDLLQVFFKGSIDHLPGDKGMFSGPTPVILESCKESDLALLLSSNKRQSSRIEFGAHQVVLVQSKEAKDKLPSILKGAIVLTIFESKGLEFDDVLLYNFFHDSMVDEKGWRVVTGYLEEHNDCIKVKERFPGSNIVPRSHKFDEKCHKVLNSELKYLYTAITRAKCNLWIYDCDLKKRLPMFDLWYKRGLVKVVGDNIKGAENQESLIFASISTPHQWKVQGDYFMRRSRWEQAKHCYDRAGDENEFLSVEANARFIVQQAKRLDKPHLYLEAAVDFLRRDELKHNIQFIDFSAQCLKRTKPQRNSFAAVLFELLGKYGEALKCYRRAKDTKNCVRLLEREGHYDEAVRIYHSPTEALAKASEYTCKEIQLPQELLPENLSYTYATQYSKLKDRQTLIEILKYMPDVSRRARFLKIGGFYSDAIKIYATNDEVEKAYRLASGRCLFKEGRDLARKNHNQSKEAEFVFHQIHDFLVRKRDKPSELEEDFKTDLNSLMKDGNPLIRAHALLLLGISNKDAGQCRSSYSIFRNHNKVAALEAFNAQSELESELKPTNLQVLDACEIANNVCRALESSSDLNPLVNQATAIYGLQKVRDVFLMPPNHNSWVSVKLRSSCKVTNDKEKDDDGMIRLQWKATKDTLAAHIRFFVENWLKKYDLDTKIKQKMYSSRIHDDIQRTPYKLCDVPRNTIASLLTEYMRSTVEYCRLGLVLNQHEMCSTAVSILQQIFSPDVSLYIPVSRQHLNTVHMIKQAFMPCIHVNPENHNHMDVWFNAWRACIISRGNTEYIDSQMNGFHMQINLQFRSTPSESFRAPPAYKFSKQDNCYFHVFDYWLFSCTLIRDRKRPLAAAKVAITDFVGTILWRRSLEMSDTNVINVLTLHTMSLFTMLTYLNHFRKTRSAKFVVPVSYTDCVDLFNLLNCQQKYDSTLYASCNTQVRDVINRKRDNNLERDCFTYLNDALSLLLVSNRKRDDPLTPEHVKDGRLSQCFRNKESLEAGTAQHCLGLALTIFANLIPFQSPFKFEETKKMLVYFFDGLLHKKGGPSYLEVGKNILQTSPKEALQPKILHYYVSRLLGKGCINGTQTMGFMIANDRGKIVFTPLPTLPTPQPNDANSVPSSNVETSQSLQPTSDPSGQVQFQSDQVSSLTSGKHILPSQGIQTLIQSPAEQAVGGKPLLPITKSIDSLPQPHTKQDNLPTMNNVATQPNSSHALNTHQQPSVPSQAVWGSPSVLDHSTNFDQPTIGLASHRPETLITSQANYPQVSSTSPQYQQHENVMQRSLHQPTHPMVNQPHGVLERHIPFMTQQSMMPMQQLAEATSLQPQLSSTSPQYQQHEKVMQQSLHQPTHSMVNQPHSVLERHTPNQPFMNQQSMMGMQQPPEATSVQPWPEFPSYQQTTAQSSYPEGNYFVPAYSMIPPTGHSDAYNYSMMRFFSDLSSYPSFFANEFQQPGEQPVASETQHQHSKMAQSSPGSNATTQPYSSSYFPSYTEHATQGVHHQNSQHPFQQTIEMQKLPAEERSHPLVQNEAVPIGSTVTRNDETEKQIQEDMSISEEDVKEPVVDGENDFWDVDEDAPGMSDIRKSKWPQVPTVEPHLIDTNIVTDEYCTICGVALQSNTTVDESVGEESGLQDGIEVYDDHVRSNGHARSYTQHKKFKESYDGCYSDMVSELTELKFSCELTQASSMRRLTDDMHETLEKYEQLLSNRQQNLNWRMGLSDIEKATDEFQRLLIDGKRKYEKFISENPMRFATEDREGDGARLGGVDSDNEFQDAINKTVEEIGEDFTLRSEKTKLEARSRKKSKKRK